MKIISYYNKDSDMAEGEAKQRKGQRIEMKLKITQLWNPRGE